MQNDTQAPNLKMILWAALFLFTFVLIGLVAFKTPPVIPEADTGGLPISYIVFFMGLMSLVMSFVIPKLIKTPANDRNADFTKFVIGLALNESCSIFAFVIGFIYHDHTLSFTLFGISALGYLIRFPKKDVSSMPSGQNTLNVE